LRPNRAELKVESRLLLHFSGLRVEESTTNCASAPGWLTLAIAKIITHTSAVLCSLIGSKRLVATMKSQPDKLGKAHI
jgi:hypothetical protein